MTNQWDPNSGSYQQYPPTQQFPQQPQQPGYGYPPPGAPGGPYGQPGPGGQPPKKNTGLIIGLVTAIVAIAAGVTVFLLINKKDAGQANPSPNPGPVNTTTQPTSTDMPVPTDMTLPTGITVPTELTAPTKQTEATQRSKPTTSSPAKSSAAAPTGSDEAQIEQAAQGFMKAILKGDPAALTEHMCAAAGDAGPMLQAVMPSMPAGMDLESMFKLSVKDIKISGNKATASMVMEMSMPGAGTPSGMDNAFPATFAKEGGKWKVCS